jgi:steroid 5-alpha reductase family enzyme
MLENLLVNTYIYSCILILYVSTVFLISQLKQDNSIMDIAYGPSFLVSAMATVLLLGTTAVLPTVILVLTGLWASRLALRIYRKNKGKPEDARYAAWRTEWQARGNLYFVLRSFLQVNLLQGCIILLVSIPFILAVTFGELFNSIFLAVGILVFLVGLAIESIADYQLDQFLARKRAGTEPAVLMKTGLFRYARRPNYFGETLIWWGFALMVLPLPYGYLGLLSPIVITYIVTKVTGPMLEKIFLDKYPTEYRAYMAETNYFIPGRPKKSVTI